MAEIVSVQLKIGLEVHVELATRTKMFSRAPSPAFAGHEADQPNTDIDPLVLGLPGSLPVINLRAVEMAIRVGLALDCSIASVTRWDRKSYFYPDMPKNYQISQYDLPLCFDGAVDMPPPLKDARSGQVALDWESAVSRRIGIIRAHLEEDAGKLLHEAPGGLPIDFSIVDLNRAGTPLLEIVTQPDFVSADEVVLFCQMLRNLCCFLGVTEGVLQKGHMRFEPNINTILTLDDGRIVKTPIVEVKNLNSFKAVRGAIEFEHKEQPERWKQDGREMGPGAKSTRGWDDHALRTVLQREKEDAHDYRYFPDPDLLPVRIDSAWIDTLRASLPEPPVARVRRYMSEFALGAKEAATLVEERDQCIFFERVVELAADSGLLRSGAGKTAANILLQSGSKRANERTRETQRETLFSHLGITPEQVAGLVKLREEGAINSGAVDELFGLLCEEDSRGVTAADLAAKKNLLIVKDDSAIDAWVEKAIAENAKAADDVRAGKDAAIGRIVGAAMKLAAGKADAATIRERILSKLGRG